MKTGSKTEIISKRGVLATPKLGLKAEAPEAIPDRTKHDPGPNRKDRMISPCMATTKDGRVCGFQCLRRSQYCLVHDPRPEIVQRRKQGSARGGRNRQRFARRIGDDTRLETVADIADLSVQALGELEAGRLDIRSATAVLFGCKTALDASAMAGRDTQGVSDRRVSAWTLDLELAALTELIAGLRRSGRPRSALERLRDFASRVSGRE